MPMSSSFHFWGKVKQASTTSTKQPSNENQHDKNQKRGAMQPPRHATSLPPVTALFVFFFGLNRRQVRAADLKNADLKGWSG